MRGSTDLNYSWFGVLVTDCDALLVLEQCLRGELAHIPRRPHDSERARLIKSGSIFVYESNASGIKRWTDGINWSPSRILSNFLVYHELEKAPPPGEKKRAIKRKRSETDLEDADTKASQRSNLEEEWTDDDRRLMGSPQDNYGWKVGGLVKKTYSFDFRGASHHIISYFDPEEVRCGKLKRPIHCTQFQETFIRPELIDQGARSRNPVTEAQIEQQRWERPLYSNDTSVTLMRQYPIQNQMPFAHPPPPAIDYRQSRPPMAPNHNPVHRSSIHFPMEPGLFNPTPGATYQPASHPPTHMRHSSMSTPMTAGYQRGVIRAQLSRTASSVDVSTDDPFAGNSLHHVRSHSAVLQSPPESKPPAIYTGDSMHDAAYTSVDHQRASYAVASPPHMAMPSIDTSSSHIISRPTLYSGPHSTTDLHPPVNLHGSLSQPPLKRGRIETSYPSFSSVQWDRALSVPDGANNASANQSHYSGQLPLEPYTFAQTGAGFVATQAAPYSHAHEQGLYGDIGSGFATSQSQALFAPPAYSSYSQLTAPS